MRTPIAAMAFLILSSVVTASAAAAQPEKARTIRWIVAHSRGDSDYGDLMKDFARRIEQKSGGALKVQITDSDASEDRVTSAAQSKVLEGTADMSQINTLVLPPLAPVQLPYLFRSHEHAEAVFDGPIGAKMLAEVPAASDNKLAALAFTYSGGYRILIGGAPLRKVADAKGLRIKGSSAVMADLAKALGASAASDSSDKFDLVEVELSRVQSAMKANPEYLQRTKYVNLTRHRMLVTAIIANAKFLASLPDDQQRLLREEVQALALAERKLSMTLEESSLRFLTKNGKEIVEIPEASRAAFEKAGAAVCAKHPELAERIAEIRAVAAKPSGRLAAAQ